MASPAMKPNSRVKRSIITAKIPTAFGRVSSKKDQMKTCMRHNLLPPPVCYPSRILPSAPRPKPQIKKTLRCPSPLSWNCPPSLCRWPATARSPPRCPQRKTRARRQVRARNTNAHAKAKANTNANTRTHRSTGTGHLLMLWYYDARQGYNKSRQQRATQGPSPPSPKLGGFVLLTQPSQQRKAATLYTKGGKLRMQYNTDRSECGSIVGSSNAVASRHTVTVPVKAQNIR